MVSTVTGSFNIFLYAQERSNLWYWRYILQFEKVKNGSMRDKMHIMTNSYETIGDVSKIDFHSGIG
jgi:hypothetical protein